MDIYISLSSLFLYNNEYYHYYTIGGREEAVTLFNLGNLQYDEFFFGKVMYRKRIDKQMDSSRSIQNHTFYKLW